MPVFSSREPGLHVADQALYSWPAQIYPLRDVFQGIVTASCEPDFQGRVTATPEDVLQGMVTANCELDFHGRVTATPEDVFQGIVTASCELDFHGRVTATPEDVFQGMVTASWESRLDGVVNVASFALDSRTPFADSLSVTGTTIVRISCGP
jgi:hypothetical protein